VPQRDLISPRARVRRRVTSVTIAAAAAMLLSGCEHGTLSTGYLPHGVTEGSERVTTLWVGSWITLLAVGALVWGLIFWSMAAYRRKKDDNELPVQLRYNIPIEILYTVVPVFMVAVFFFYTARDETALLDTSKKPDVTINVIGKQWSWDFNYVDGNVHESGTQAIMTGKPGAEETIPTLYLPVNERVEFILTARDVIHSFWVPQFLQKLDMIPGRVNKFQVVPTETGTFKGKCAELCGAYHSQMLFNVKVVEKAEYEAHLNDLKAKGQTGLLDNGLNRERLMPGQEKLLTPNTGN
jgi:cytochrome c oxidase subunit 2